LAEQPSAPCAEGAKANQLSVLSQAGWARCEAWRKKVGHTPKGVGLEVGFANAKRRTLSKRFKFATISAGNTAQPFHH